MYNKIIELNDNNFNSKILESKKLFLVDFWASWCNPCKIIAPILENLANEIDNVVFSKINIEKNPIITSKYKISSIPSLLLFNNGKLISMKTGVLSKEQIIDFISIKIDKLKK